MRILLRNAVHCVDSDGSQIGGTAELLYELKLPRFGYGWDLRTALSIVSVRPYDSSDKGILTTIFVGPSFKKGGRPTRGIEGAGVTPGVTLSYLDLSGEQTWSIGFSFRILAWIKLDAFEDE